MQYKKELDRKTNPQNPPKLIPSSFSIFTDTKPPDQKLHHSLDNTSFQTVNHHILSYFICITSNH